MRLFILMCVALLLVSACNLNNQAATPTAVQQKLNAAVTQALRDPALARKLVDQGGEPAPMTIDQFRDFIKSESAQYGRIVEAAKITPDN